MQGRPREVLAEMRTLAAPAAGQPWLLCKGERRVLRHILAGVDMPGARRHARLAALAARARRIVWLDRSGIVVSKCAQVRIAAFPGRVHGAGGEHEQQPPQSRTYLALAYPRGVRHLMSAPIGTTWSKLFPDVCKEFRKGRELELFYQGQVNMNSPIPYAPESAPLLVTVRYPSVAEIFAAGSGDRATGRHSQAASSSREPPSSSRDWVLQIDEERTRADAVIPHGRVAEAAEASPRERTPRRLRVLHPPPSEPVDLCIDEASDEEAEEETL
eukprot:6475114-Amphidinium_carterae.1